MLTNKHLNEEIRKVEDNIKELKKDGQVYEADSLKIGVLQLKLLQNIRANFVRVMEHLKIPLVSSEKSEGRTTTEKPSENDSKKQ